MREPKGSWEREEGGSSAFLPHVQARRRNKGSSFPQPTAPSLLCKLFSSQANSLWIPRRGTAAWTQGQNAFLLSVRCVCLQGAPCLKLYIQCAFSLKALLPTGHTRAPACCLWTSPIVTVPRILVTVLGSKKKGFKCILQAKPSNLASVSSVNSVI